MFVFVLGLSLVVALILLMLNISNVHKRKLLESEIAALKSEKETLSRFIALDDLTPAQSRRYLAERVDHTSRQDVHSLLFVDLDDFKTVNDGYGHEVGDALLIKISQAMVDTCREGDFVARLGGDEFCVFLDKCNLAQAEVVADRFRTAVAQAELIVDGVAVKRSASIGVAELLPQQAMVDALYIADAALYAAKGAGRNCVQAADETVLAGIEQRKSEPTAEDVADAMTAGHITYFVQPIFDLVERRAIGVEALLRWVTPEGDVRLPAHFFDKMAANYRFGLRPPIDDANTLASAFMSLDPPLFCAWNISSSFLSKSVDDDGRWINELLRGR